MICFKDIRTDSHIRKTRCMTIIDILTEAETNARTIDALKPAHRTFLENVVHEEVRTAVKNTFSS